jgi:hypothetical protein
MKNFKFKSNPKLDSMINSILAGSKFSSLQEYLEWRIQDDYLKAVKGQKIA